MLNHDIATRNKFLSLFVRVAWEEFTPRNKIECSVETTWYVATGLDAI